METAIINGRLVSARGITKADIWMKDGKIDGIGHYGGNGKTYDASGCLVFPGFIDAHTHFQMKAGDTATADSFETGTAAAICGGTTTVIDFATQERGGSLAEALEEWNRRAGGQCSCDYAFHMAVTHWNEMTRRELKEIVNAGVTSFKAYMAYDNLRLSDEDIYNLLASARELGALVGVHCEMGDMVNAGVAGELAAGHTGPRYHPVSRPSQAEALAVKRFLKLSQITKSPAWVVHLSTRSGLFELCAARLLEQGVLAETCPQYLTMTSEKYLLPGFEGAKYVCSPPLRSDEDKKALWRGLLNGDINIVSTDHCSFNFKGQKELGVGDFSKIPNGLPGVEHRPALIWTYGAGEGLTPEKMAALLSETPAKAFGMYPRKGALLPGSDADIVVWDPMEEWIISAAEQTQNVDYTPWEGEAVRGRAKAVFLRGKKCAEGGRLILPRRGRFIKRGVSQNFK